MYDNRVKIIFINEEGSLENCNARLSISLMYHWSYSLDQMDKHLIR